MIRYSAVIKKHDKESTQPKTFTNHDIKRHKHMPHMHKVGAMNYHIPCVVSLAYLLITIFAPCAFTTARSNYATAS
jgi:hypothetical protein